jgi:hypothetical protein
MSHNSPLPGLDKIDPAPIHGFGLGPGRHRNQELLSPSPMPVRPFPAFPATGPKVLATAQRTEIAPRCVANQHDVSTMPTIAAIRPTARHMSLPPKAHAPVAAASALNPDFRLVVHADAA